VRTLDVAPDEMVSDRLREELLAHVGVYGINVRRGGAKLILCREAPPAVHGAVDLSDRSWSRLIMDAMAVLTRTEDRVLRVSGLSLMDPNIVIEIVLEERPLRLAVVDFAGGIFVLSLLISLVTATLVFLTLQWMLVRPMRRITDSMTAFREDPEDAQRIFKPSHRTDEIGVAQHELTNMQGALRAALQQKAHLAALGTAVAKINTICAASCLPRLSSPTGSKAARIPTSGGSRRPWCPRSIAPSACAAIRWTMSGKKKSRCGGRELPWRRSLRMSLTA